MRLEERIAGHPNKINFPTNFNKSITAANDFFFFFFWERDIDIDFVLLRNFQEISRYFGPWS